MTAHAKLSASGSSKWLNCPGSVQAESTIPNISSKYAEEGTLAHELADQCLSSGINAEKYIGKTIIAYSGDKLSEFIVDVTMARFVQEYLDYVRSFENEHTQLYTEDRVDFSNIVPEGFGTMDAAIIDYKTGVCHIFDLKYGQGVEVTAEGNTQGLLYATGFYNEMKCLEVIKSFVIHIVQPRKYATSSWSVTLDQLEAFGVEAKRKAEEALKPDAVRVPGEKQCEFCRAKANCGALDKFTSSIISNDFENLEDKQDLSEERIKQILDNKKLIESFLKAVEDRALETLMQGGNVLGYKLVQGRSNRVWADGAENELIAKLGDDAYEKKLIGITAAEKKLKKAEVDKLTIKPVGKLTLAPESDKRPAAKAISDDFDNLNIVKDAD